MDSSEAHEGCLPATPHEAHAACNIDAPRGQGRPAADRTSDKPDRFGFAKTRVSLIERIKLTDRKSKEWNPLIEQLFRLYRAPIERLIASRLFAAQFSRDEIGEVTNDFFTELVLSRNAITRFSFDHDGKPAPFRRWIKTLVSRFATNAGKERASQKRDSSKTISFDQYLSDHPHDAATSRDPGEAFFDEEVAATMVGEVLATMHKYYASQDTVALFEQLRPFLLDVDGIEDGAYERIGRTLDQNPGAVRTAMHRMKKTFDGLLQSHIVSVTVRGVSAAEIDTEARDIVAAYARYQAR